MSESVDRDGGRRPAGDPAATMKLERRPRAWRRAQRPAGGTPAVRRRDGGAPYLPPAPRELRAGRGVL